MTTKQLAEIQARLDAATPGPWGTRDGRTTVYAVNDNGVIHPRGQRPAGDNFPMVSRALSHKDAALIANATADLAALLAYTEQLEGLLRDLCEDSRAAAEAMRLRRGAETALAHLENAGLDAYTQDRITALSSARMALRNAVAPPSLPAAAALAAKKPGGA